MDIQKTYDAIAKISSKDRISVNILRGKKTSRTIYFRHWKTGEEKEYNLDYSKDYVNLTKLTCPFDKTFLIEIEEKGSSYNYLSCPNCKEDYPFTENQEEINQQAREHVLRYIRRLPQLAKERKDLEARIKHAKNIGLIKSSNRQIN